MYPEVYRNNREVQRHQPKGKKKVATLAVASSLLSGGFAFGIIPPLPFGLDKSVDRFADAVEKNVVTQKRIDTNVNALKKAIDKQATLGESVDKSFASLMEASKKFEGEVAALAQSENRFRSLDLTLDSAKRFNKLLIDNLERIETTWNRDLKTALAEYRSTLEFAPIQMRELAAEFYTDSQNYIQESNRAAALNDARACDALAVMSERRFALLFNARPGEASVEETTEQRALALRELKQVHINREKLFAAWPSSYGNDGIERYFSAVDEHLRAVEQFNATMGRLVDELEKTVEQESAIRQRAPEPKEPPARPARIVKTSVRTVKSQEPPPVQEASQEPQPVQAPAPRPQQQVALRPPAQVVEYRHLHNGQVIIHHSAPVHGGVYYEVNGHLVPARTYP